jgi:hypothetical protein
METSILSFVLRKKFVVAIKMIVGINNVGDDCVCVSLCAVRLRMCFVDVLLLGVYILRLVARARSLARSFFLYSTTL